MDDDDEEDYVCKVRNGKKAMYENGGKKDIGNRKEMETIQPIRVTKTTFSLHRAKREKNEKSTIPRDSTTLEKTKWGEASVFKVF